MGTTERRVREREEKRRLILEAARELFLKEGFESVTMRRIAERIEYSPMALYQYFPKKEMLLAELCNETFAGLTRKLVRMEAEPGDPLTKLKKGLRIYIAFGIAHPHDYILTFMTLTPPGSLEATSGPGREAFACLERGVRICVDAGLIHLPMREAAEVLYAGIHGLTALLITRREFFETRQNRLIDLTVETLVAGLNSP
jgi:AcrR family transcriptional regulator